MLSQLAIKNFVVVKQLEMDLSKGMTAITGETGAGKSIAIDALSLCLGARAEASMVRKGHDKAEVCATFDVTCLPEAMQWLKQNDLEQQQECMIRRVISAEGRSKAYINGTPVPLQQLKAIGQYLVSIHGQHAHQQLLKAEVQRQLLDSYANHPDLLDKTRSTYQQLRLKRKEYADLVAQQQRRADRRQLLSYQVSELDEFALQEHEFIELEIEHRRLSHSQTLLQEAQLSFHQLYEAEQFNALSAVQGSVDKLSELQQHDSALAPIVTMLNEASIQIDEAAQELRNYCEQLEIDPLKLQQVELRYSQAMELSRKHQIQPEQLYNFHQQLAAEFKQIGQDETTLQELQQACDSLAQRYQQQAQSLSLSRQKAANKLARQVEKHIHNMNMDRAKFAIHVEFDANKEPTATGLDTISFVVATNPGQELDRLEKVVSGGELSRIGLAIQVIASSSNSVATMIFDEVDTGISGPTAAVVGQLLRSLGQKVQVMCVTHLPQVAARAHNQLFVTKISDRNQTETRMLPLTDHQRVEELARLLAGDTLTDSALANARELLKNP